jgi:N-acetylglutamate synthase
LVDPDARATRPVSGLGPHCVGQRVVVRRLLPGRSGPTGGPAMTDLLGTMLVWGEGRTVVEAESGERVAIALGDIVSGKPVPPRRSVRLRVTAEEAERRALLGWPPVESEPLGDWVLRAASGFSTRANSVLALEDPGMSVAAALVRVREFYAERGLPAWAQVVVGSAAEQALLDHGWVSARPGEADTQFQIASVAQLTRSLSLPQPAGPSGPDTLTPPTRPVLTPQPADPSGPDTLTPPSRRDWSAAEVTSAPVASSAWLSNDERALASPEAARAVLEGPAEVDFVSVGSPIVAKGRGSVVDDWAGLTDIWVAPDHRRQGLARLVMSALVERAAERGARTAYLQTRGDNAAALALYDELGFVTHHTYRYLRPGPGAA